MSDAALSPNESALILDELAEALPGLSFTRPDADIRAVKLGEEGARPVERLTILERIGEKVARALKDAIEPLARIRGQADLPTVETKTYGEWQAAAPAFISLTHYRLRPLKGGMLIAIEPEFVAGLLESFYGGPGGGPRPFKGQDFSAGEEMLLGRLLERVVAILTEHWQDFAPVEPQLAAQETSPVYMAFTRPEELVAIHRFGLTAGRVSGAVTVLYPMAMLRPIEAEMANRVLEDEDPDANADWRIRLGGALAHVRLPVRSVLARPEISVAELLALKPGDVIPINLPPRTPLLAGTQRIGDGVIGEQDGRAALMIEKIGQA